MFSSVLFRRIFLSTCLIVLGISVISYLAMVPFMKDYVDRIEETNAKTILDNVYNFLEIEYQSIESYKEDTKEAYKRQLKNITLIQESFLHNKYRQYLNGELSEDEAKHSALEEMRTFRYGKNDYVWVSDFQYRLISHPDPKLHKADFSNVQDIYGTPIIPELVKTAREKNEGYTSYWWRRLGEEKPIEKLSYSKLFRPWNWVIGTGVYIDDIQEEYERRKKNMIQTVGRILKDIKIARTGYLYIFDSDMKMIVYPNSDLEGSDISDLLNPVTNNPIGQDLVAVSRKSDPRLDYKWDKPEDKGNYIYDKISWVKPFKELDWYIASSVYKEELNKSSVLLRNRIMIISSLTLFLILGMATLLLRRILGPVRDLSGVAQRVKNGDLSVKCPTDRSDEFGVLAEVFNDMIEQIGENIEQLDKKVQEQTRDLQESLEKTRAKEQQIAHINQMVQAVNSSLNLDEVIATVMEVLQDVFHFYQLGIFLADDRKENLLFTKYYGEGITDRERREVGMLSFPLKPRISFVCETFLKRTYYSFSPITEDLLMHFMPLDKTLYEINPVKAYLLYPLEVQNEFIGTIVFANTQKPFTLNEEEIETIHHYVSQIATAINNARLAEALERARGVAEEATRAKSEFLANMSHEIRTPMNAVIGFSELALKSETTAAKQREYLGKIQASANSLLGIINDILDISKIESGKLEIEAIDFFLDDVLDKIAGLLAIQVEDKGLELLFNVDGDVPRYLIGDPLRLGQVLTNLTNNAVKFTRAGQIVLGVRRFETNEPAANVTLIFSIQDTGIGMSREQISRLFQAFSQADTSTTRKYGGTGLGLTISKRLVEMMEGEVTIQSEPGQGSTFSFTARFGVQADPKTKALYPEGIQGTKVLVVDDNPTARDILQKMLVSFSCDVETAVSGEEALQVIQEKADSFPYQLVILDWKMPGMDGIETARQIQGLGGPSKSPRMIMITAHGQEEIRSKARQIGIESFLLKPVNPSMLFEAIIHGFDLTAGHQELFPEKPSELTEALEKVRGAHILVVDDNRINLEVAQELLETVGFRTTLANNGQEALDLLLLEQTENDFEIILMDIQNPAQLFVPGKAGRPGVAFRV